MNSILLTSENSQILLIHTIFYSRVQVTSDDQYQDFSIYLTGKWVMEVFINVEKTNCIIAVQTLRVTVMDRA